LRRCDSKISYVWGIFQPKTDDKPTGDEAPATATATAAAENPTDNSSSLETIEHRLNGAQRSSSEITVDDGVLTETDAM